jgi:mRNA interferase RelE/StbE
MTPPNPFEVIVSPKAARELERMSPLAVARLRRPILSLAFEPHPVAATRVVGTAFWRIRVGESRVIYLVDDVARRVVILRVARRSERTYRGL